MVLAEIGHFDPARKILLRHQQATQQHNAGRNSNILCLQP
jgi:hypothetical protein